MHTQEEILNGQVNGTLTENKGEEILRQDPMKNTPFTIVTRFTDDNKPLRFLALGKYRISEDFTSDIDIEDWLLENIWNVIVTITFITNDTISKQPQILNQLNNTKNEQ